MSTVPDRADVPPEYRWNLESIFESDKAWEEAYDAVQPEIASLREYEGRATADADSLLTVLRLKESVMRETERLAAYAYMRRDEDTRRQRYQALANRAQSLMSSARSAASYIGPEIQTLDRTEIDGYQEAEPALAGYDHYFDEILRMKPHTRSTEIESLLADLGEVTGAAGEIYQMLSNADMVFPTVEDPDGEPVEITQSNFVKLQKEPDRDFRRIVYESFYDEWDAVRNAVATAYSNSVTSDVKLARVRNFETAKEAALYGPNIPIDVYDTLIETVRSNLDRLHRHMELKRRGLGLDDLRMWDVYMPASGGESPEIEYEQAVEYVLDSLRPLGTEYHDRVAAGLDERWVDVYQNSGKQSGAYSGGTYDTQPFILMNYQDDIASLFTLAHELGHSLHSQYTSESQPWVYSGYEIFVAEVASTVNETLLTHHLLDTLDDPDFRRHILNEYLERFRTTLFRQTLFAEFEDRTHEIVEDDGALTADGLDDIFGELKAEYYEPATVDDRIAREWMRIPHFYRAFYVYQYATGISAAVALTARILEEGEPAADRYLEFLRAGSSEYPLELLEIAGVDMRDADPIENALGVYDEFLDEMESLVESSG